MNLWDQASDTKSEDDREAMVWEISELVAAGASRIDALASAAAEAVCHAMADICAVGVLSDDESKIHPVGVFHRDERLNDLLKAASGSAWEPFGGVSEQVLGTGVPVVFENLDLGAMARGRPWAQAFSGETAMYTALVVPMRAVGTRVGVVAMARSASGPVFSEDDFPFAQDVADRLGLAVCTMALQDQIGRSAAAAIESPRVDERLSLLNNREREIIGHIAEGLTSREIGERVFLSVRTVEWHRARLMTKLGVSKRSDLIALGRDLLT